MVADPEGEAVVVNVRLGTYVCERLCVGVGEREKVGVGERLRVGVGEKVKLGDGLKVRVGVRLKEGVQETVLTVGVRPEWVGVGLGERVGVGLSLVEMEGDGSVRGPCHNEAAKIAPALWAGFSVVFLGGKGGYVYTHIYIHTYTYAYIHIYTCTYTHIYRHKYMYMNT